jgi:hypothetical protein
MIKNSSFELLATVPSLQLHGNYRGSGSTVVCEYGSRFKGNDFFKEKTKDLIKQRPGTSTAVILGCVCFGG